MSGFFAGIVSSLLLSPVLALAWRRRKYLTDATAVRPTRNSDAVARRLERIAANRGEDVLAHWVAHLAVVESLAPRRKGRPASSTARYWWHRFPPLFTC